MSEIIPEGTYVMRGVRGDFGESATKKTPFGRVALTIEDGPQKGRQATWTGYFTENTTDRTIASLRLMGCTFPNNDVMDLTGLGNNLVQGVVEHEKYQDQNGEERVVAKVAWINALAGAVRDTERMADANAAQFRNRMKASIALAKRGAGGASSSNGSGGAPRPELPATGSDDDIPF